VKIVLVSAAGINAIDATGLHTLASLVERFHVQDQTIAFCGLKKQVIDAMERDGVWTRIGKHSSYRTEHQALDALLPTLPAPAR
jgi:SulP family sulfate permease